jgi:hypothetical protein
MFFMQRTSLTSEIFGYIVCLIATLVFFVSIAGIVNNSFRVVHPTMRPAMMSRHHMRPHSPWQLQGSAAQPGPMSAIPGRNFGAMRDRFVADAPYDAVRRLVLAIVMLALSIVVFRRTFDWLNPRQAAAS